MTVGNCTSSNTAVSGRRHKKEKLKKKEGEMLVTYFHAMRPVSKALVHGLAVYASNAATSHTQCCAIRTVLLHEFYRQRALE
jgi:hypothetical protein